MLTSLAGGREKNQEFSLRNRIDSKENDIEIDDDDFSNPYASDHANQQDDPVSQFMDIVPNSENPPISDPHEMFLPGLVIHMVPEKRNFGMLSWQGKQSYKALIVDRECFKDMVVSTSMFLDHLPWRYDCHVFPCLFSFRYFNDFINGFVRVMVLIFLQMSRRHEKGFGSSKRRSFR